MLRLALAAFLLFSTAQSLPPNTVLVGQAFVVQADPVSNNATTTASAYRLYINNAIVQELPVASAVQNGVVTFSHAGLPTVGSYSIIVSVLGQAIDPKAVPQTIETKSQTLKISAIDPTAPPPPPGTLATPANLHLDWPTVQPTNMLANAGFEAGTAGWVGITNLNRSVVTGTSHTGTSSARFVLSNRWLLYASQTLPVSGGMDYTASGWIQTQNATTGAHLALEWRDAAGNVLRTDTVGTGSGTTPWTEYVGTVTAPAGATDVVFSARTPIEPDNSGTVWFDDLVFFRK